MTFRVLAMLFVTSVSWTWASEPEYAKFGWPDQVPLKVTMTRVQTQELDGESNSIEIVIEFKITPYRRGSQTELLISEQKILTLNGQKFIPPRKDYELGPIVYFLQPTLTIDSSGRLVGGGSLSEIIDSFDGQLTLNTSDDRSKSTTMQTVGLVQMNFWNQLVTYWTDKDLTKRGDLVISDTVPVPTLPGYTVQTTDKVTITPRQDGSSQIRMTSVADEKELIALVTKTSNGRLKARNFSIVSTEDLITDPMTLVPKTYYFKKTVVIVDDTGKRMTQLQSEKADFVALMP